MIWYLTKSLLAYTAMRTCSVVVRSSPIKYIKLESCLLLSVGCISYTPTSLTPSRNEVGVSFRTTSLSWVGLITH